MNTPSILVLAIVGLLLGSLLNLIADRFLESSAKHANGIKLFRIIYSFITLRPIQQTSTNQTPMRYPIGELALTILVPLTFHSLGWQWEILIAYILLIGLYVIVQTDLAEMIIPNEIVFFGSAITLLLRLFIHPLPVWNYAIAALLCSGFLLLIGIVFEKLLKKEAMGGGDIKLYVFLGLVLGIKLTMLSLFLASLVGLLILLPLQFFQRKRVGEPFPFGPFIAVGAWIAYIWGNQLVDWYITLLQ
ncbi:MAG: prepilin peptidase [Gorillibacterium sp.]|nr:prepilin peptidase [Gorillibacterium sp.]